MVHDPRPAPGDSSMTAGDGSLADTVLVSNRGPLTFDLIDGRPVAVASGGGLAGSLQPPAEGLMATEGLRVELVEPEPDVYNLAYNVVSNATLWFCHHHLFDSARRPRTDRRWMKAWDAYRHFNRLMAERVAEVAPAGGRVLVQDYHLALVAPVLSELRPDLATVHFSHTPFADPSVLRMLPTSVGDEILTAMSRFGSCGFHSPRWAAAYGAGLASAGIEGPTCPTFVAPLSSDPERLRASSSTPEVAAHRGEWN